MTLEYLNWDSIFFGLRIGRIALTDCLSESSLNQLLTQAKEEQYNLIYVFTPELIRLSPDILATKNGKLVDRKVLYEIDIRGKEIKPDNTIEDWTGKYLTDDILDLSYLSGQYSRFLTDNKMPTNAFQKMYKEWIDKSLSGILADKVFIARENKEIIGFSTLKINTDLKGEIGLISVAEKAQGKRYGTKLINQCVAYLKTNSIDNLAVPTQINNAAACKFYEHYGFSKYSITNIYHFWL